MLISILELSSRMSTSELWWSSED